MTVVIEKDNITVISGLDPSLDYHVIVDATNSHGTKSSPSQILPAGIYMYIQIVFFSIFFSLAISADKASTGGVVAGVVVGLLALILVILLRGLIILWRRKR